MSISYGFHYEIGPFFINILLSYILAQGAMLELGKTKK